jgi:alanyl-tRNA synthetase
MLDGRAVICQRLDGRDAEALRFLAQRLAEGGAVALLGSEYEGKAQMVFACDKGVPLDMNATLKAVLPLVGGRGGGQKSLAQGGGAEVAGLTAALDAARIALFDRA